MDSNELILSFDDCCGADEFIRLLTLVLFVRVGEVLYETYKKF